MGGGFETSVIGVCRCAYELASYHCNLSAHTRSVPSIPLTSLNVGCTLDSIHSLAKRLKSLAVTLLMPQMPSYVASSVLSETQVRSCSTSG